MAPPKPDPAHTFCLPPSGFMRSVMRHPGPQSYIGQGCSHSHMLFQIPDTDTDPGTGTGILAGLNSKLVAENSPSKALISRVPTLVIGMELARPRNPHGPLLGALVHSRAWPKMSEYRALSIRMPREWETIQYLCNPKTGNDGKTTDAGLVRELLQDFYVSSGNKRPEQIIIFSVLDFDCYTFGYRYGAPESQLSQVLKAELDQITQACKLFDDTWSPELVMIKFFEPDNVLPRAYYDGRFCGGEIDDFANTRPSLYETEWDDLKLSSGDLKELVDSLSYVHRMCIEAISYVGWAYAGSKSTKIEEPNQKRMKKKIEPGDVDLQRERGFIDDGDMLALYALGHLNRKEGDKYKFERYLHKDCGYFGFKDSKDPPTMKRWNHVSMYVQETTGEAVAQKIVFAELSYFEGKYDTIKHVVLDPSEPQDIVYGCGFCSPGHPGGDYQSPHPADKTQYQVGHWYRVPGVCMRGGLIPE